MSVSTPILIVEDQSNWQDTLSRIISRLGYKTTVAKNYDEGIREINKNIPHLIIVDIRLKEDDRNNQDGMKLLEYIKHYDLPCKALIVTGYAEDITLPFSITREAFTNYQVIDILPKSMFPTDEFRSKVKKIMGKIDSNTNFHAMVQILNKSSEQSLCQNKNYTVNISVRVDWSDIDEHTDNLVLDVKLFSESINLQNRHNVLHMTRGSDKTESWEFQITPTVLGQQNLNVEFYHKNAWLFALNKEIDVVRCVS